MEWLLEGLSCGRLLLLGILMIGHHVQAEMCVATPSGIEKVKLPTGEVALFCSSRMPWSTNEFAHITTCTESGTVEMSYTCPGTKGIVNCSAEAPVPANSVVAQTEEVDKVTAVHYLTCNDPLVWMSGAKGVLTQCITDTWTPVLDFCDEACTLPRDCSSLAEFGFTTTGEYDVVLSGVEGDSPTRVTCEMSEVQGDSGWVVLYRYAFPVTPIQGFVNTEPSGNYNDWNYFIGFQAIRDMNWNEDGSVRPLVLHMRITLDGGMVYFATFGSVEITNDDHLKLKTAGTFHGTAGYIVADNLDKSPGSDLWWECPPNTVDKFYFCTSVTWDKMQIPSLGSPNITHLVVLARPVSFDNEVACPPMINYSPWTWLWASSAFLDESRAPGSIANYTCRNYYVEGVSRPEADRTTSGIATCNSGTTPAWSVIPEVPCQFVCPSNWDRIPGADYCILPSTTASARGVLGAALECGGNSYSTLALLHQNGMDTSKLTEGTYYYTGHTYMSVHGSFYPTLPTSITCAANEPCEGSDTLACLAVMVQKAGEPLQYRAQDCNRADTHHLCGWPGVCPPNYHLHEGLCYQVLSPVTPYTNLADALSACVTIGGTLAYPETLARITYLEGLVRMQSTFVEPGTAILGLNDKFGDWTVENRYTPAEDVISSAGITIGNAHYRLLQVGGLGWSLTHTTLTPWGGVRFAICQLFGVRECWTPPLPPTVNMTFTYDNMTHVRASASYSCYPGYFLNGNLVVRNQTAECVGLLGGWLMNPPTDPECLAIDVCTVPTSPSMLINTMGINHLQLNGTVTFTCPPNTATQSLDTNQTLTCTESFMNTYFYVPQTVAACDVCLGSPSAVNATTSWSENTMYTIGMEVVVTCFMSHTFNLSGRSNQAVSCLETGWSDPLPCYKACLLEPPLAGASMTQEPLLLTNNAVGTEVVYTCDGTLKTLLEGSTSLVASTTVICGEDGQWNLTTPLPPCLAYCEGEPTVPNAITTWSATEHYLTGQNVTATCLDKYILVNDETNTQMLNCIETGWTPGTPCEKGCSTGIPAAGANMTAPTLTDRREGVTLNYTCNPGTFATVDVTQPPVTFITVTCSTSGLWGANAAAVETIILPECKKGTTVQPPMSGGAVLSGDDPPYVIGSVLTKSCEEGFTSLTGVPSTTLTFDGTVWVPDDPNFHCLAEEQFTKPTECLDTTSLAA